MKRKRTKPVMTKTAPIMPKKDWDAWVKQHKNDPELNIGYSFPRRSCTGR